MKPGIPEEIVLLIASFCDNWTIVSISFLNKNCQKWIKGFINRAYGIDVFSLINPTRFFGGSMKAEILNIFIHEDPNAAYMYHVIEFTDFVWLKSLAQKNINVVAVVKQGYLSYLVRSERSKVKITIRIGQRYRYSTIDVFISTTHPLLWPLDCIALLQRVFNHNFFSLYKLRREIKDARTNDFLTSYRAR